jgi:digeranylgeranylglycerophospholipid reductase
MTFLDVAVIGGGPAGLHTARLLAEGGAAVAVLEKKPEIGQGVVCTGIVGRDIFREFDLPADSAGPEFQDVRIVSSSGRTIFYRHPSPFAAVVDRQKFDRALAARAREAGAEIETGTTVLDFESSPEGFAVKILRNGEPVSRRARLIVLATGVDRRLHPRLGLTAPRRFVYGAQAEISDGSNSRPSIFVGTRTAPGGFAWAVPLGEGTTRLGLITNAPPQAAFHEFIARYYPQADLDRARRPLEIKAIAQGMAVTTVRDGVLAVGEAAGQVKTTTGGGIYYGLLGARFAAEAILDALRQGTLGASALSPYEQRWKAALRREISVGYYARKLYSWMSEDQFENLFVLAQSDGIIPQIQREGNFDWQSGLILSLLRKAPVFEIFKGLARKPAFLDRLLD